MEKLNDITFYTIDKAIRSYRVYAQKKLRQHGFKITIDQWLIIKSILENPGISQLELGEKVFKDNASVTRIIDLLVRDNYLRRETHPSDRRKSNLIVTLAGKAVIEEVHEIVLQNRQAALQGVSDTDLATLNQVLQNIISNCQNQAL